MLSDRFGNFCHLFCRAMSLLTLEARFCIIGSMKIEEFTSGSWKPCYQYKCFIPEKINHSWGWDSASLTIKLEQAIRSLSALNACSQFVPDINLFIRMHIVREANASSRIEGTRTNMDEALLPEASIPAELHNDWREVNNYVEAMREAVEELNQLPLSMRLLKKAHAQLMRGVRGEFKMPGEIRTSQNWIGGGSISSARFVPPAPEYLSELLSDLEFFWHNDKIEVPNLIRAAITHYQFETIHPFLDGNGRVGRLLIPFYLISQGDLALPSLYISDYFEHKRDIYYSKLTAVREKNDLLSWVDFFLDAVKVTSDKGCLTFQDIFRFRDKMNDYCAQKRTRSSVLQQIIKFLYSQPRATISEIAQGATLDYRTTLRAVKELEKDNILTASTESARNKIYNLQEYLDIFKK